MRELIDFAKRFGSADPETTVQAAYERLQTYPNAIRDTRYFLYNTVVQLVRAAR